MACAGFGFLNSTSSYYYELSSCYFRSAETLSYADAETYCQDGGGYLAEIDSADDFSWILNTTYTASGQSETWFGLKLYYAVDRFAYYRDGIYTFPSTSFWAAGEPAVYGSGCIYYGDDGTWASTRSCDAAKSVLCQREANTNSPTIRAIRTTDCDGSSDTCSCSNTCANTYTPWFSIYGVTYGTLTFRWKDQGYGNNKGKIYCRSDEGPWQTFAKYAPKTYETVVELPIPYACLGGNMDFSYIVGSGGGHALYVDNLNLYVEYLEQAPLPPILATLSFTQTQNDTLNNNGVLISELMLYDKLGELILIEAGETTRPGDYLHLRPGDPSWTYNWYSDASGAFDGNMFSMAFDRSRANANMRFYLSSGVAATVASVEVYFNFDSVGLDDESRWEYMSHVTASLYNGKLEVDSGSVPVWSQQMPADFQTTRPMMVTFSTTLQAQVTVDKSNYTVGEPIIVSFERTTLATTTDWLGISLVNVAPSSEMELVDPTPALDGYYNWQYVCGGYNGKGENTGCSSIITSGTVTFLNGVGVAGAYKLNYFDDDGYTVVGSPATFTVIADPTVSPTAAPTELSCGTGYYLYQEWSSDGNVDESCRQCSAGRYQETPGRSTRCLACAGGTYAPGRGASECLPCPSNYYCPAGGIRPIECLAGTSSGPRSSVCAACPSGEYEGEGGEGGVCTQCPA